MPLAVYIILCLIWSSTWSAITYVIKDVPPITGAAARFWLAAMIFFAVHLIRPIRFPSSWRVRLALLAWGVPQIAVSYAVVYWSELHISTGMTALLFATYPFFVAMFSARWLAGEAWNFGKLLGLVCGIVGVGLVFLESLKLSSELAPYAATGVVISAFACGISIVMIKRHYINVDTIALTSLQMTGGAIALTIVAFAIEQPLRASWTTSSLLATGYLAVFGSAIAFLGYYWLVKKFDTTIGATITFVTPPLAIFWGWLFLDEKVSAWVLLGAVFVLLGIRSVLTGARSARYRGRSGPLAESVMPCSDAPVGQAESVMPCSDVPVGLTESVMQCPDTPVRQAGAGCG